MKQKLKESFKESFASVLPIVVLTYILNLFLPMPFNLMLIFLFSSLLLIIGTALFTFGVDLSMVIIGQKIGNKLVKSKKVWIVLLVSFIIGTAVTIAEPDLKVLADQLISIPNLIMIMTISLGVGISLLLSSIRSLYGWSLNKMLFIGYIIVMILMYLVPSEFVPVAFDSGGITTGTISIPFIMTLGLGLTANRTDKKAQESSFGLVALCSIGPIISMLLLGMVYPGNSSYELELKETIVIVDYLKQIIISMKDVLLSLSPILIVFIIFKLFTKEITSKECHKIIFGIIVIFIGLSLFFTATSLGFMDVGYFIGSSLTSNNKLLIIIFSAIVSCYISIAEPAVQVLNEQVENITEGNISKKTMNIAMALGVSLATVLSLIRILTNTSFIHYILIAQSISLLLIFFTPKVFTAIAFDAGGATGGTLTAAFLLPIAIGVCVATDTNILQGAFGLAAFVSLIPIIIIQIIGIIYKIRVNIINKYINDIDDSIIDFKGGYND